MIPGSEQRPAFLYVPSAEDRAELDLALAHIGMAVPLSYDGDPRAQLHQAPQAGLIILDIDGDAAWAATLRALKMHAPKVPVVVCSRLADPRLWIDVLDAGADDLLCKPLVSQEVQTVLCNVLQQTKGRPWLAPLPAYAA
jgi:DNA-binding response OmpR family regulator